METTTEQQTTTEKTVKNNLFIMRLGYGAFVLLGLYYVIIKGDWSSGVAQFGIGLVFDPFDNTVMWKDRPLYQKVWMITHLVLLFVFFGIMFTK